MQLGRIAQAWRYPVKSMAGEALDEARLEPEVGIAGDRSFAVIDVETGTVASAKHVRKWSGMLAHAAKLVAPRRVEVTLADGTTLDSALPDIDARLSAALGRTVRLSATPPAQASYEDDSSGAAKAEPL